MAGPPWSPGDLKEAHRHSGQNRAEIERSTVCGCFCCLRTFGPGAITRWPDPPGREYAMCPYCGVDSVIGDASGFPMTQEFLGAMKRYWFELPAG